MKVRNIDMALFWNNVDVIRRKKLPLMLSFALKCNRDEVERIVPAYQEALTKANKEGEEATQEFLKQEINVNIQTVNKSVLEKMDSDSRFDVLTGMEYAIIDFMIDKE